MRFRPSFLILCLTLGGALPALAKDAPAPTASPAPQQIEISADQSLEFYQKQNMYVARGNAKAVRGETTITADLLTAHQRDKAAAPAATKATAKPNGSPTGSGDIDQMTAEGNVIITKPNTRITGDKAVNHVDDHVMVLTGSNLRYETDKQIVTARDSLEYWDEKKLAVARGDAKAVQGDRHVEGDVLTAEFRDQPNGQTQLYKLSALGHVVVVTQNDVTRGERAVYDAGRDIAIVSGHVLITRNDGTQLTGDVAESDFAAGQSRLLNDGSGRVRALLPSKSSPTSSKATKPAAGGVAKP